MNTQKEYPQISDLLIEVLERDFPNRLPKHFKNIYELGILIGQQKVIDKLKTEKQYQDNN